MNISLKRALVISLITLFLQGCATPAPPYIEPTMGKVAQVKFVARTTNLNFGVTHAEGGMVGCSCSSTPLRIIGIFNNVAALAPGSSNYADKGRSTDRFTVSVPANGDEFRFILGAPKYSTTTYTTKLTYCQAHIGFIPEPDMKYEAVYDDSVNQCSMAVFMIGSNGERKKVDTREYPMCALRNDNADGISEKIREYCLKNNELYEGM